MNEFVKWLVEWCSEHGSAESRLLTPDPRHLVDTFELLDAVAKKTGVSRDQIGAWFNAGQEKAGAETIVVKMSNEETASILKRFSIGVVSRYFEIGQPPHEGTVALVCVSPFDDSAFLWVGASTEAREAMAAPLPGFTKAQDVVEKLVNTVPAAPVGMLRVLVFSENGAGAGYLATSPRAQA